jgi:hypothetical protein
MLIVDYVFRSSITAAKIRRESKYSTTGPACTPMINFKRLKIESFNMQRFEK